MGISFVPAFASGIELDPPGERDFINDRADMLDPVSLSTIKPICDRLLSDKAIPIIIVTIESMAKYGGDNMSIEAFAAELFDQWQIGHKNLGENYWNTGILLLVSKNDRKARIELGAGWGRSEDALCRQIMDQQIIPQFKKGNFSTGIVAGVKALDKMGRKLELPQGVSFSGEKKGRGGFNLWWVAAIFALLIFSIVSLSRNGSGGWAWFFWAAVFGMLGAVLIAFLSSIGDSDGGGGGFSGGSFGGGFSGGGGASGSW
ncbi:MAG: TPM domain-containing protein [Verrucomicrobiota bacterium]